MPATAEPFVYLNGRVLPKSEACLSVEERGVFFADGVYEVTRYYAGRPFELDRHLARLDRSLQAIRLPPPPELPQLPRITDDLLDRNGTPDAKVYWQITRGPAPRDYALPRAARPTVLVIAYALGPIDLGEPCPTLRAATAPDERWSNCWIKSLMLLANMLAANAALDAGADVAILHRDGRVTEGAAANVFVVRDGVLWTHPADRWILPGVTRAVVLDLARELGLPVREEAVAVDELRAADEVFLTGTTTQVAAVTSVDGQTIGGGVPGPITRRLHAAFLDRVRQACLSPVGTAR